MSQNYAPRSAWHFGLPRTCSALDTLWNFRGETMAPLCGHTGLIGPVPKGSWRLSWMNPRSHEPNLKRQSNEWTHPGSPLPKIVKPTQCAVKVMQIVEYLIDEVILHPTALPRLPTLHVPAPPPSSTFSWENDDTWCYRTPSFFMTMQGVTPLLLSQTSYAARNGRFWNIHRTHPIRVHEITISLPKWKSHYEGPDTTQEMNLSVL